MSDHTDFGQGLGAHLERTIDLTRGQEQAALSDAFYAALSDDDPEKLYERAPCGYLSTSLDGTITKANQTFLALTGYPSRELIGRRRFADLLTAGGRIYHETHYAPALQMQGQVHEIALEIVRADGTRLPVLVNSVLDRDVTGAPTMIRTAVFDATERRHYEVELLRAKQRAEASEDRAAALAKTLQQTLIPPSPPEVAGLDIGAVYRPAGSGAEVGGDFYDIFELGPDDWIVVVGDVRGKGADAAVVTALVRHSVRAATVRTPSPSEALAVVNRVLLRDGVERFSTVALARLRLQPGARGDWAATIALGGHPPGLVKRDGSVSEVGRPGSIVGPFADAEFFDATVPLAPGDFLLLYTDGVTEGRRDREFYGERRLIAEMVRHSGGAQSLAEAVLADVLDFQGGNPSDDIAVVVVGVADAADVKA
ncbi:MAG: PP2C family protein-serine/threonine phosphatase [Acidothermaceae bacterium]